MEGLVGRRETCHCPHHRPGRCSGGTRGQVPLPAQSWEKEVPTSSELHLRPCSRAARPGILRFDRRCNTKARRTPHRSLLAGLLDLTISPPPPFPFHLLHPFPPDSACCLGLCACQLASTPAHAPPPPSRENSLPRHSPPTPLSPPASWPKELQRPPWWPRLMKSTPTVSPNQSRAPSTQLGRSLRQRHGEKRLTRRFSPRPPAQDAREYVPCSASAVCQDDPIRCPAGRLDEGKNGRLTEM